MHNIDRHIRIVTAFLNANGTFVTVRFTNSAGKQRTINGRTNVRWKGQKSPTMISDNLVLVWSHRDRGFRSIRTDRIECIKSCGEEIMV